MAGLAGGCFLATFVLSSAYARYTVTLSYDSALPGSDSSGKAAVQMFRYLANALFLMPWQGDVPMGVNI